MVVFSHILPGLSTGIEQLKVIATKYNSVVMTIINMISSTPTLIYILLGKRLTSQLKNYQLQEICLNKGMIPLQP